MSLFNRAAAAVLLLYAVMPDGAGAHEQRGGAAHAIPSSIESEHRELHARLAKATRSGGRTAAAAKEVEKLLEPHFKKEEQFAMPALSLLPALAAGDLPRDTAAVIGMTDRLKQELPDMLREHKAIGGAVERLRMAAQDERKPEAAAFAEALMAHALQEEQILYPSAIMVGEYLKLKR